MAEKSIRLGKAAGELNVGISTLTEFLASKGVKIDINPNTKLEGSHYELLQSEFAADQTIKEQSKMTNVKREKRETISIRDTRQNEAPSIEDEDEVDQAAFDKSKILLQLLLKQKLRKKSKL
jgi:translation initiation factor IF-2